MVSTENGTYLCKKCGAKLNCTYDSYHCKSCDIWAEKKCGD